MKPTLMLRYTYGCFFPIWICLWFNSRNLANEQAPNVCFMEKQNILFMFIGIQHACFRYVCIYVKNLILCNREYMYLPVLEPCHEKTWFLHIQKQRRRSASLQPCSAFIFATEIEQTLYFLNLKFQASIHLLWLYSPVCDGPSRKPR